MTIATRDSHREGLDGKLVVPVQTVRRSSTAEIERLYADHYRDVYRYILAFTGSADDAEEITADAFERALRTWSSIPERPVAWLLVTARRLATDRWRRARRMVAILARARPSPPSDATSAAEFGLWFQSIATVLTDRQREVLVLRYQRDLTDTDIAMVMGLSESGVRSLAARALGVLRAHPELLA